MVFDGPADHVKRQTEALERLAEAAERIADAVEDGDG